jgi:hypothetical protein
VLPKGGAPEIVGRHGALIRKIKPTLHAYGHSRFNRSTIFDATTYPDDTFVFCRIQRIAAWKLLCVFQDGKIHTPC